MSLVNISDVKVRGGCEQCMRTRITNHHLTQIGNNPGTFFDSFRFEITFEVLSELKEGM
jgi:hypothetical protein